MRLPYPWRKPTCAKCGRLLQGNCVANGRSFYHPRCDPRLTPSFKHRMRVK